MNECGSQKTVLYKFKNCAAAAKEVKTKVMNSNNRSLSCGMSGNGMCLGVQGISHCPVVWEALVLGKLHFAKSALRGDDVERDVRVSLRLPEVIVSVASSSALPGVPTVHWIRKCLILHFDYLYVANYIYLIKNIYDRKISFLWFYELPLYARYMKMKIYYKTIPL